MTMTTDDLVYMSKISEQAERYDDMIQYVKDLIKSKDKLSPSERNLLSVAYKNSVGSRRTAWRMLSSIEHKEENKGGNFLDLVRDYKKSIEAELSKLCNDVIGILEGQLIPNSQDKESKVFFLKMKGDYFRYISEFASGDFKQKVSDSALRSYEEASEICNEIVPTHPVKLGLALNFSVFYYEVMNEPQKACDFARKAFEDALANIEDLADEEYKDASTILQLLRDNLTLWSTELHEEEGEI